MDLAEPPLGGILVSTSVGKRWNDEMELDADKEESESSVQGSEDSPSEANIGLG